MNFTHCIVNNILLPYNITICTCFIYSDPSHNLYPLSLPFYFYFCHCLKSDSVKNQQQQQKRNIYPNVLI